MSIALSINYAIKWTLSHCACLIFNKILSVTFHSTGDEFPKSLYKGKHSFCYKFYVQLVQ